MTNYNLLSDESRIWIYQSKEIIPEESCLEIQRYIDQFTFNWVSHNRALKAYGEVRSNRFILLMVDESLSNASGCSIDSSVQFVQSLEKHFSLQLFDRMTFTYLDGEEIKAADRDTFAELYKTKVINDDTLVFDNLIKTKYELDNNWIKPLKDSWHYRMV